MWLWKKFWNTDIVGKTYILIILFIMIVATITVITRYKNADTNQVVNEQKNEVIQEVDVSEQNIISDDSIIVAEIEENIKNEIIEETPKDTTKNNVETQEKQKTTINTAKTDNKSTEQTKSKEETKETVDKEQINNDTAQIINKKDEVKQEEQQTQVQEKEDSNQEQQETNKQEDKPEIEEKEDTTSQEIVREVKRNDTYIQKMKNYITTNDKSSYSIVVDESIVNNTYGFTYSEFNMSGYLGCYSIYRIYAQDYYVNGEYVETRCYID